MHAVAAAYPQSTLNGTPTDSSLNGTASYETHLAGQEESGCVYLSAPPPPEPSGQDCDDLLTEFNTPQGLNLFFKSIVNVMLGKHCTLITAAKKSKVFST